MSVGTSAGRTRPGFFRAAWLVAAKDLRLEWKTLESLSAMGLFSLIVLVIFNFAFDLTTVRTMGVGKLVPGVLWTTFAFSGIVGFTRAFQVERRREALTALLLAPVDRGALFAGKSLANLALLTGLQVVLLPLSAVFFDWNLFEVGGPLLFVVILHTIGLAQLGTLFGAVVSRLNRGEALLATLLLPAATPLFLSAVRCTASVLDGRGLAEERHWLLVTAGFDVLYFLVALLLFEFVLEES